jgi:alpha-glucosidase
VFGSAGRLVASEFRQKLKDAETALNGNPPLLVLDSHNRTCSWTRYSDGVHDVAIAKLLATLLLAPRGAALIYYGQELGMENNDPKRKEDVQDPVGRRGWPENKGRDGERTPMQSNADMYAGFSSAPKTWLPLAPGYTERNVTSETAAPDSLLNYYKAMIRLRKQYASLREGEFEAGESGEDVIAWISKSHGETAVVALNFSGPPTTITINVGTPGLRTTQATTLLSSFFAAGTLVRMEKLTLPPYGAFVGLVR